MLTSNLDGLLLPLGLLSGEGLPEVERRYTVLTDGYAREKQSKVNGENWHSKAVDVMKAWVGENNAEAFLEPKGMQRLRNGHETRVPDVGSILKVVSGEQPP